MKILITNDDGYKSEGIKLLYEQAKTYGEVLLVAPHHHMSGASASRVFWTKVRVHTHHDDIYSIEGTPADAVSLALHGLNFRPDIVISGINNGLNVGADTVYSGTVGACMEALKARIPAIALSVDFDHFEQVKKDLKKVLDYIFDNNLISNQYLLNVNFIAREFNESKGIMITDLGFRPTEHFYVADGDHYTTKRKFDDFEFLPDTDLHAVNNGYISITPLKFANQTEKGLEELRSKVSKIVEK
ncbi:MAG: 5'/3'-nucleotidase SurE [Candidatus Izemoplasmatales bacterium]|nr:5'/3'-nucleotidase SurE [Candidatus Izemoplasmatales bacterium]